MAKDFDYIDLHFVPPKLVKDVLEEFIVDSYKKNLKSIKIITGKGIGVYRMIAIKVCKSFDFIEKINIAPPWESGEGALYIYFKR